MVVSEKCFEKDLFVGPRVFGKSPSVSAAVSAGRYRSTRDRNVFNFGLLLEKLLIHLQTPSTALSHLPRTDPLNIKAALSEVF